MAPWLGSTIGLYSKTARSSCSGSPFTPGYRLHFTGKQGCRLGSLPRWSCGMFSRSLSSLPDCVQPEPLLDSWEGLQICFLALVGSENRLHGWYSLLAGDPSQAKLPMALTGHQVGSAGRQIQWLESPWTPSKRKCGLSRYLCVSI